MVAAVRLYEKQKKQVDTDHGVVRIAGGDWLVNCFYGKCWLWSSNKTEE